MDKRRQERLNSEIKKVISVALREMRDPKISSLTTLTDVSITNDLSYCDLKFSILGDEHEKNQIITTLQDASGYFRSHIAKNIRIRQVPEIRVKLDESIEYSNRINEILKDLNLGNDEN